MPCFVTVRVSAWSHTASSSERSILCTGVRFHRLGDKELAVITPTLLDLAWLRFRAAGVFSPDRQSAI
jgi:hypothetical protein